MKADFAHIPRTDGVPASSRVAVASHQCAAPPAASCRRRCPYTGSPRQLGLRTGRSSITQQSCIQQCRPLRHTAYCKAAASSPPPLAGLAAAFQSALQQFQAGLQGPATPVNTGAAIAVNHLSYHPPGAEKPLISDVSLRLAANKLGLVYGKSGAGKSTLLYLLAGLLQQTSGSISLQPAAGMPVQAAGSMELTGAPQRRTHVGMVFQFPERHFLGATLAEEITFAWPRANLLARQSAAHALSPILRSTGLEDVPVSQPLATLSGGQQRRVALAVALARKPGLLLLDEPLAGLDWRARADVAALLRQLKAQCTMLVVSHDLRELSSVVDCAWQMDTGGKLSSAPWPPMPGSAAATSFSFQS